MTDLRRSSFFNSPDQVFLAEFPQSFDEEKLVQALEDAGVPREAIVLLSAEDADAVDEGVSSSGPGNVIRRVLTGDEVRLEKAYIEALKEGRPVVQVYVPEEDEAKREKIESILNDSATSLSYFGRRTFQNLPS